MTPMFFAVACLEGTCVSLLLVSLWQVLDETQQSLLFGLGAAGLVYFAKHTGVW